MCFTEDVNKWGITKLFKCKSSLNFWLVHSKYLHLNFFYFYFYFFSCDYLNR